MRGYKIPQGIYIRARISLSLNSTLPSVFAREQSIDFSLAIFAFLWKARKPIFSREKKGFLPPYIKK
ncbi:MAG: hypothetical protein A2007_00855 [Verrucomicrobia bacterium GWC2_42_7]|nr:MAG: hypothetical protein A2007_00855 [Verrucomicrobia bacterium GWC2_42_7]